jgi:radical SAM protein with 4Fe4S-binding SPASM domain
MIPYADLRSQPRLDLNAVIPLPFPLTVYVEPTNICNLSCNFCPQSIDGYADKAGYHQHMPVAVFENLMQQLKDMNLRSLKLYFFGEPLMHPDIGTLCSLAAPVCERVELTTNGIPLTSRKAREIIGSGIHYIRLSWYGHNERFVKNLSLLRDKRRAMRRSIPRLAIKVYDAAQAREVKSLIPSRIYDELVIEQLHTMGSDMVHLRSYEENKAACPYAFYTLVIKANGDVVPCCVAWEQSLVCGNIHQQSIAQIWRGDKLREIQRLHLQGRRNELAACRSCDTIFSSPDSVDGVTPEEFERRLEVPHE